ncbi:molybdate transporter 1-like [Nymphaea colorata]|uniref:SLC26A/SulP transporter domain-containing protein n=1 Tax=Nymphaea colorata TaxID=210225 RepID=A0A5K1DVU4_9MAGN|nr:molybdate transporter 1-like [Nymphaea colorata]
MAGKGTPPPSSHHETAITLPETPSFRPPSYSSTFLKTLKENLAFRARWAEINGAMGDLGTFIPIVISLTLVNGLDLGTTLIFTGVYNVVTGALFGVPMPVQPMKSIAAAAIAEGKSFGVPEIMAAGILTSAVVFLLGATGLMRLVYRYVPLPVVRGIQLAQGLSFAQSAVTYVRYSQDFSKGKSGSHPRPWLGLDGLILALVAFGFLVVISSIIDARNAAPEEDEEEARSRPASIRDRVMKFLGYLPSAVIVFVLGVVLAIVRKPSILSDLKAGPSHAHVVKISSESWKQGFIKGTVPQLPLTVLNSVLAVCKLGADLFPAREFTATRISVSVGLMNLVGCWFGAMPCCHGAGGMAGQYKFGGRSGACVALLGLVKLVLGFVIGSSLVGILREFPTGLLGVLLFFAGTELAMAARDMGTKPEWFVMLVVTAVSMVGSYGAALGFVCGMVAHVLLKVKDLHPRRLT